MIRINLYPHQKEALEKLSSGSILCGGVGSGKSMTSLAYFHIKECGGSIGVDGRLTPPKTPKNLYIITTARKRDTLEWEDECAKFMLPSNSETGFADISVTVDSWNNIHKYEQVKDAMFIFDEQRVVGSGSWVKSFLRITKANHWLLLSATPGDTWMDYIPVFVANGFYKNRTEFLRRHAVYNRFAKYPKVDRFVETGRLEALRRHITVVMNYKKSTTPHFVNIPTSYDESLFKRVAIDRWNPFDDCPIPNVSEFCYLMRKVVNSDPSRIGAIVKLLSKHPKMIIFYNFDYELDLLRGLSSKCTLAEWNGHNHEPIPKTDSWIYLVQYTAGAEGWNCTETNAIVFYSQNYSYRTMTQAAGRIDRLNTPYSDLYYYTMRSSSSIDIGIARTLTGKKNFNENAFVDSSKFA